MSDRLTMIPVGAREPKIFAKNRQSQKPAPAMYYAGNICTENFRI
jgi:hypothetical protein